MPALRGLAWLLLLQSLGEVLTRALMLPLPGPVLGLLMLLPLLRWSWVREPVAACADLLLAHLSLLFVPVGVGVLAHLDLLGAHGLGLMLALVVSTWIGLAVTAWVLQAIWRAPSNPTDAGGG